MDALPYGIRDCKLTPYTDAAGTVLSGSSIDLPNMQTFSFSETEEFQELRGDDRVVTTRGQGAQVEWSLESGGISLRAWAIFTGGEVIEEGVAPARRVILRKRGSSNRPFFRVEGQAISDSGGDVHAIVYRCRCNDTVEGEFADGEFFVSSVSGLGLSLLSEDFDLLYDLIQNETQTTIPLVAAPNPVPPLSAPQNLQQTAVTATSISLRWSPITAADGYAVEQSINGTTWTAVTDANGGEPTNPETTITGLTAGTAYHFRVVALRGGDEGPESQGIGPVSTASA